MGDSISMRNVVGGKLKKVIHGVGFKSLVYFRRAGNKTAKNFTEQAHVLLLDPHDQTRSEMAEYVRPFVAKVSSTADSAVACRTIKAMFQEGSEKVDIVLAAVSVRAIDVLRCVMLAAAPLLSAEEPEADSESVADNATSVTPSVVGAQKRTPPVRRKKPVVVPVLIVSYPGATAALRMRCLEMESCVGCFSVAPGVGGPETRYGGLLEKVGLVLQRYAKVQGEYSLLAPEGGRDESYPRVTLVHELADMNASVDVEKLLDNRFTSQRRALTEVAHRPQLFSDDPAEASDPGALVEQSWRASFSEEMKPFVLRKSALPEEAKSALGLSKAILEETKFLQTQLQNDRRQSSLTRSPQSRRLHHLHRQHVERQLEIDRELIKHDAAADLLFGEIHEPMVQQSSGTTSQRFLSEARRHWIAERWDRAHECCSRAIAADPSASLGYHCRAFVLCHVNQTRRALSDLNASVELAEKEKDLNKMRSKTFDFDEFCKLLHNRAIALVRTGQDHRAIGDLYKCIELCPNNLNIVHTRALLLRRLRRYGEAYQDYHQLFEDRLYQEVQQEIAEGGGQESLAQYIKIHANLRQRRKASVSVSTATSATSTNSANLGVRVGGEDPDLLPGTFGRSRRSQNFAIVAHAKTLQEQQPKRVRKSVARTFQTQSEALGFDMNEGSRHLAVLDANLEQLRHQQMSNESSIDKVSANAQPLCHAVDELPMELEPIIEDLKVIVSDELPDLLDRAQPLEEFVQRYSASPGASTSSSASSTSPRDCEVGEREAEAQKKSEIENDVAAKAQAEAELEAGAEASANVVTITEREAKAMTLPETDTATVTDKTGDSISRQSGNNNNDRIKDAVDGSTPDPGAVVPSEVLEADGNERETAATKIVVSHSSSPINEAFSQQRMKGKKAVLLRQLSRGHSGQSFQVEGVLQRRRTSMDLAALVMAMDLDHSLAKPATVLDTLRECSSTSVESTTTATRKSRPPVPNGARRLARRGAETFGLQEYKQLFGSEPSLYSELFEKPSAVQEALLHDPEAREPAHLAEIAKFLGTCEQMREEPPEVLFSVAEVVEYRVLREGESVFIQGEEAYAMAWILSGEVEGYIQEYDRPPSSIGRLGTRRSIGSESLMVGPPGHNAAPRFFASYETKADTELLVLLAGSFHALLFEPFYRQQRYKFGHLKRSGIFEDWSMEDVDRLARYARVEAYEESTTIVFQGDKPNFLYFLVQGICSAQKRPDTIAQLQRKLVDFKEALRKLQTQYSFHHTLNVNSGRHLFGDTGAPSPVRIRDHSRRNRGPTSKRQASFPLIDEDSVAAKASRAQSKRKSLDKTISWTELKRTKVESRIAVLERKIAYMQQREDSSTITTLPHESYEVVRITPVSIFGEACILNPAEGTSLGTIVALSPVEVIRVHRKLLHSFEISLRLIEKVRSKAILYPEDGEIAQKMRGAADWINFRNIMIASLNTKRWPTDPNAVDVGRDASRFENPLTL